MSTPASRRNSCRGTVCGSRASSEGYVRRRASNSSSIAPGAQTEDSSVSLSQPIFTITLRFLLAIDLWLSKRLGVCACEKSAWGGIRPLVRLVELSGHVVPWLIGTVYTFLRGESVEEQEVMLNLGLALILDVLLVRTVKTVVRRRRPSQNRSDILSAFFMERYSFPSGHASRAAMCARFFLAQLVDTASLRVLVVGWAFLVSLSRLLLARHYVTDVGVGLAMGYCQYSLVEKLWVTWDCLQDLLLMPLSERLNRAYVGLWLVNWKH
ncbi:polyisoprenoid diphosphate/phosphate phosphohydrolase PLPP6-like [Mugil cephalus]|uniref:polyisoprenoid diphosphate/phosphate phosphohydrolase PLPP6-like n=1 Tax=Mugil cephalus TaxID=48193 RepID=UPI001FB5788D|nr:polyisoprenoid diphosphate/phosphate phosphohydrolase PLPP6-like [Mugil cephalus]XP_047446112.1 polyisoprenoid diphosphate/phosphate phosphohydrolase PLPP6-like [Mugil cephalus]